MAQENQAIKRQKLDGGKSKQVSQLKLHYLFHYLTAMCLTDCCYH